MYLTFQDCVDMSDLSKDEIDAIAEHEHISEILAVELGSYIIHQPGGEKRIKRMILDDIKQAANNGDVERAALLKKVLAYFVVQHAPSCKTSTAPAGDVEAIPHSASLIQTHRENEKLAGNSSG